MESVLSKIAAVEIKELIDGYLADNSKVVPTQQKIAAILKAEGAVQNRLLDCKQVVPHAKNRDGEILTASGVEIRAERLNGVGFSRALMEQGAWAIEDHPVTKHLAKAAIQHFAKDKRFAKYRESEVVAGSVGTGHTNHVIAAVRDQCPCAVPSIALNGRYNQTLFYANSDFKQVSDEGNHWQVIRWEIDEAFPQIADIFQAALNADQQVSEGDNR